MNKGFTKLMMGTYLALAVGSVAYASEGRITIDAGHGGDEYPGAVKNGISEKEIDLAMWYFANGRTLKNYEGKFSYRDRLSLNLICHQLGVSKSAAIIRLKDLGYIEDRPYIEFVDPLEGWA